MDVRRRPGSWRDEAVWIGIRSDSPVGASHHSHVPERIDDLVDFARRSDLPALVAIAAASLRAVANTQQLVAEIDEIRASRDTRLTARKDSGAWRLLDVFTRQPVLNARPPPLKNWASNSRTSPHRFGRSSPPGS